MLSIGRSAQLTVVYCLVDDGLKSGKNGGNRRKSNHHPKCTDAEIIAVAMMPQLFWMRDAQTHLFIGESQ